MAQLNQFWPQVVVRPKMELLWMQRLDYRGNMDLYEMSSWSQSGELLSDPWPISQQQQQQLWHLRNVIAGTKDSTQSLWNNRRLLQHRSYRQSQTVQIKADIHHKWCPDTAGSRCLSPAASAGGPSGSRCPVVTVEQDLWGDCGTNPPTTAHAWTGSDRSGAVNMTGGGH